MTITYRKLKGAPLSIDELDQNFREIEERIKELEHSNVSKTHGGIASIKEDGVNIVFESHLGEVIGKLKFPFKVFRPRGEWRKVENYAFYDLCVFKGKTYFCNTPHKASQNFKENLTYWDVIFSADKSSKKKGEVL